MSPTVEDLVVEAIELRSQVYFPATVTPDSLVRAVQDCRKCIDRAEAILVLLTRLRGRKFAAMTSALHQFDDAWDKAATTHRAASSALDYSGPRERYSEFNLSSMTEKRAHRIAEQEWKEVDVAVDAVRVIHRGIDGVRGDLHVALRAMNLETRLEA